MADRLNERRRGPEGASAKPMAGRIGLVVALFLLAAVLLLISCAEQQIVGPPSVATIEIQIGDTTVTISGALQLDATLRDSAGVAFIGPPIIWSSSDESVFTISSSGLVTPFATGIALAVATSGGVSSSLAIIVVPDPVISPSQGSLGFASTEGGLDPPAQSVTIENTGGGILTDLAVGAITYADGQPTDWLTAGLAGSGNFYTLLVRSSVINASGDTLPGDVTYQAQIALTSSLASNSPLMIDVTLFVDEPLDTDLPPIYASFRTTRRGLLPEEQKFQLALEGVSPPELGVIDYAAGADGWLSASIALPDTVVLGVTVTDLDVRTYLATLPVFNASSTQLVIISYTVDPPDQFGSIVALTATNQAATVGSTVSALPRVLVTDWTGTPVANQEVIFTVTDGDGSVDGGTQSTQVTASDGTATVADWTLGTVAGDNELTAMATEVSPIVGNPVVFAANGDPGAAATIARAAGNGQEIIIGEDLDNIQALVEDEFGNAVEDVVVDLEIVTGGGDLSQVTAVTNSSGIATLIGGNWDLGAPGSAQPGDGRYSNIVRFTINEGTPEEESVTFTEFGIQSFGTHVDDILNACTSCHPGDTDYPFTWETLVEETEGGSAINRENPTCADLVVEGPPGDASNSFLMQKLDGAGGPAVLPSGCGDRMPPGGPFLSDSLRNVIRSWINNEAPDN